MVAGGGCKTKETFILKMEEVKPCIYADRSDPVGNKNNDELERQKYFWIFILE